MEKNKKPPLSKGEEKEDFRERKEPIPPSLEGKIKTPSISSLFLGWKIKICAYILFFGRGN